MSKKSLSPSSIPPVWLPMIATLRYHQGDWYRFQFGAYRKVSERYVRRLAFEFIRERYGVEVATADFVQKVVACAALQVHVDESLGPPPFWMADEPAARLVVMRNGLLDLDRAIAGDADCLRPHTDELFATCKLDYDYDSVAECPLFDAFLGMFTCGDEEKANLLLEFAAWLFLPQLRLQRFMLLVGNGRNGKSVWCHVLVHLLGVANVSSVALESFGRRFQLTATLNKALNLVPDCSEVDKLSEGTLKAFVAQDLMQFDRKNRELLEAFPTARLLICCNKLPRWRDRSEGIWRRQLIVRCEHQVEYEDAALPEKLAAEIPGIFVRHVLPAARRLLQRGKFLLPASCAAELEKARIDCNPALRFCEEQLIAAPDAAFVSRDDLYRQYRDWSLNWGYTGVLSYSSLLEEIKAAFPAARETRRGPKHGYRPRGWAGIEWRGDREFIDEQVTNFGNEPTTNTVQEPQPRLYRA